MIYILGIICSTVMFSVQFLFQKMFQKQESSAPEISLTYSLANSVFAIILLVLKGGTSFEFSALSFLIAFLTGCRGVAMTYMSIKVMERANLSVFSLFSMLGGMLLPFVYSVILGGEMLTWQKVVCVLFLVFALYWEMRGQRKELIGQEQKNKFAFLWYMGVFILNGMASVFAKIHQSAPSRLTVSASAYTLLEKLTAFTLCAVLLLLFIRKGHKPKLTRPVKSLSFVASASVLNTVANLILLTALLHVDASIQYPIVTGGVIIFSLLLELLTGSKPKRYTVVAAIVSFVGLCFLAV